MEALFVTGTHDDLIHKPNGAYSKLVRLQETGTTRLSREDGVRPSGVFGKRELPLDNVQTGKDKDEQSKVPISEVSIMRLAKLNRPELPLFLFGSFAAAANGLVFPVLGLLLSSAINAFFEPPAKMKKDIAFWAEMFLVLGIGVALATPCRSFTFGIIGERLIRRVRRLTFEKILHREISWFDEEANSRLPTFHNKAPNFPFVVCVTYIA